MVSRLEEARTRLSFADFRVLSIPMRVQFGLDRPCIQAWLVVPERGSARWGHSSASRARLRVPGARQQLGSATAPKRGGIRILGNGKPARRVAIGEGEDWTRVLRKPVLRSWCLRGEGGYGKEQEELAGVAAWVIYTMVTIYRLCVVIERCLSVT